MLSMKLLKDHSEFFFLFPRSMFWFLLQEILHSLEIVLRYLARLFYLSSFWAPCPFPLSFSPHNSTASQYRMWLWTGHHFVECYCLLVFVGYFQDLVHFCLVIMLLWVIYKAICIWWNATHGWYQNDSVFVRPWWNQASKTSWILVCCAFTCPSKEPAQPCTISLFPCWLLVSSFFLSWSIMYRVYTDSCHDDLTLKMRWTSEKKTDLMKVEYCVHSLVLTVQLKPYSKKGRHE